MHLAPLDQSGVDLRIFPASLHQKKFTEEVRLTSASSHRFEWMVGFFYTDEDNDHQQIVHALDLQGEVLDAFDPFAIVALPTSIQNMLCSGTRPTSSTSASI